MPRIILFVENAGDKIASSDKIACYIAADTLPAAKIKELAASKKMVLCIGDKALEICKEYNLDGVVKEIDVKKPVKAQLKPLREALRKKTLGVIIPARRHEAMLAGEAEPEFIAFYPLENGHDAELLSWYNDLFLIPAAWVVDGREDLAADVDFLIVKAKNFENFGC